MYAENKHILKLSIFNSIIRMLQIGTAFFMGVYFIEIGFTGAEIGLIFGVHTITSILTILPSGFSNDVFKSKHLISFSLILLGIQYLGMGTSHSLTLIVALFFFGGLGKALYLPSIDSLFHKTGQKKGIRTKIAIFQGIQHLMIGAGMIMTGYLLTANIPFEWIFIFVGVGHVLMALVSQFLLPENETSKLEIVQYKHDLFKKEILLLLLIVFLFATHIGAEVTSYGLFLEQVLKLNRFKMGLYMGIAVLFMSITSVIIAKNLKKWRAGNVLLYGLLLSGLFHILMTVENPMLSLIFRIFHEAGDAAMFFFLYYGINKMFDLERMGGNNGVVQLVSRSGGTLGALAFGAIGGYYGYDKPLIISGIISICAFLLALKFKYEYNPDRPSR